MRFILVHGGFHGAWCWSRVIPELEKLGHQAIAVDLPGHGARVNDDPRSFADRATAILAILQPGDVLVGHSGGGYDITVAADAAPEKVAHLVYLAAGLPLEGRTLLEATGGVAKRDEKTGELRPVQLMDDTTGMLRFIRPNAQGRMEWLSQEGAREFFYHDCDDETVAWAFSKLSPSAKSFPEETFALKNFWQADLPRSYILCKQDRSKPHQMSLQVIERLGVEPLVIDASHSPFLSKPAELAALLVKATTTKPTGPLRPN
ncbi:MAG: alpha/beta fold hydrolase [Rhodospirillaceae bacterium]|nr:MAG: alpha/beta fold hydrolase [Rhodospirillaceae bacterium]